MMLYLHTVLLYSLEPYLVASQLSIGNLRVHMAALIQRPENETSHWQEAVLSSETIEFLPFSYVLGMQFKECSCCYLSSGQYISTTCRTPGYHIMVVDLRKISSAFKDEVNRACMRSMFNPVPQSTKNGDLNAVACEGSSR